MEGLRKKPLIAGHILSETSPGVSISPGEPPGACSGGTPIFTFTAMCHLATMIVSNILRQIGSKVATQAVLRSAALAVALTCVSTQAASRLVAWGDMNFNQMVDSATVREGSVTGIAAGSFHNVMIQRTGVVTAWGDNTFGQVQASSPLRRRAVAIAAGNVHTVALLQNGTVASWGESSGQYGSYAQSSTIPAGLRGVTKIAAGAVHTLALKQDGTVTALGFRSLWPMQRSGRVDGCGGNRRRHVSQPGLAR